MGLGRPREVESGSNLIYFSAWHEKSMCWWNGHYFAASHSWLIWAFLEIARCMCTVPSPAPRGKQRGEDSLTLHKRHSVICDIPFSQSFYWPKWERRNVGQEHRTRGWRRHCWVSWLTLPWTSIPKSLKCFVMLTLFRRFDVLWDQTCQALYGLWLLHLD